MDSAVETRTNDLREQATVESECDDDDEEEEDELVGVKPNNNKSKITKSRGIHMILILL